MKIFTFLFISAIVALIIWAIYKSRVKKSGFDVPEVFPEKWRKFLLKEVRFYARLTAEEQTIFEADIQRFLRRIRITGVKCKVEEEDRLLVASSAVIPIFKFPEWEYKDLVEVLLYPVLFTEKYDLEGADRYAAGMVGSGGAINNVVIFSKPALRLGFKNTSDKHNVGIHEFVHLFDKQDGNIDGMPMIMMEHQATLPWIDLMRKKTEEILQGKSDINPYGASNPQEFLAVSSEYFFERPNLLKEKHPQLYEVLSEVFQNDLAKKRK